MTQMPSSTGGSEEGRPPTDFVMAAEPPGWPKGLGVFSIVWGTLGIICSGCVTILAFAGTAFYEWGRQQRSKAGQPDIGPMPDVFKATGLEIGSTLVWMLGAVILLAAGISLVRRSASGRSLHLTYAAISIVGTFMGLVAGFMKHGAIVAYIAAHPNDPFLKQPGSTMGSSLVFPVVSAVLSWIYPAFILLWFLVIKRRPEDLGSRFEEPLV